MTHNPLPIPVFQDQEDVACCGSSLAPPALEDERAGYTICRYVDGFVSTDLGAVPQVSIRPDLLDWLGAARARLGLQRDTYRVSPGLYCAGNPTHESPVLVTANYKLTFDSLRRELSGLDVWILVLDTRGVNVWCASAHKTFGNAELLQRVKLSGLAKIVSHHQLILPQFGASGVDARAIEKACGFKVVWGPLRAEDIPQFLGNSGKVLPGMRKLSFSMMERLVLTPVELVMALKPTLLIMTVMLAISGFGPDLYLPDQAWVRWLSFFVPAFLFGLLSGVVLVPALLPWLPFRSFYLKGIMAALPVAGAVIYWWGSNLWAEAVAQMLICLVVSSYTAMNFTGATPYVSPSGVEKEMCSAIPVQIVMTLAVLVLWIAQPFM